MRLDTPLTKFGHGIIHRKRSFQLSNVLPYIRAVGARRGLQIIEFPLLSHTHCGMALIEMSNQLRQRIALSE